MKARIQNRIPGIWLYQPVGDAESALFQAVSAAASFCGASSHAFGPEAAGMTVSVLIAGQIPAEEYTGTVPEEPVLLMDGLDRKGLDAFLAALRERCAANGVPAIALKSVVTTVNRGWVFADLAVELAKEHALLHRK